MAALTPAQYTLLRAEYVAASGPIDALLPPNDRTTRVPIAVGRDLEAGQVRAVPALGPVTVLGAAFGAAFVLVGWRETIANPTGPGSITQLCAGAFPVSEVV